MEITEKLLIELQNRLKVGSRRGVHLNAIPSRSRYKFDLTRLSQINKDLPKSFIDSLLTEMPMKFKISWKDNVPDLNTLFEDDQNQLVKITKSFENLINQTEAIESEKGINTFGFGFPLLIRRDQSDNKLTVAPILIWSLRIKRTKEFNTWEIHRTEDDPIYINEVLINHLQNDSKIEIEKISSEFLDDGVIDKNELVDICMNIINAINSSTDSNLREIFEKKLEDIKPIPEKKHYDKLPLNSNNSFIDFCGLFSIFEVQKQNIIQDYGNLLGLEGTTIDLEEMEKHTFQAISSVETDPSQQGILHSLGTTRNILIQGPPGTGKSQSLTAILVNALENKKKTIVVCEKRTALEVLYNSLNDKGLGHQCVLLKDIVKDRKSAVNIVREIIDNSSYKRYRYSHSKETLDNIIDKAKSLIDSINRKHKKINEKLIGNKNWTYVIGQLLSELKGTNEKYYLELPKDCFRYDSVELSGVLELIRIGHDYYNDYIPNKELSFINPVKLIGDNPYLIEQQIVADFEHYKKACNSICETKSIYQKEYFKIREWQLSQQIDEIKSVNDRILDILSKYSHNEDFYDQNRTNSFLYKILSVFSKERKITRLDQSAIISLFDNFVTTVLKCEEFENVSLPNGIKEKGIYIESFASVIHDKKKYFRNQVEAEFKDLNLIEDIKEEYNTDTRQEIQKEIEILRNRIIQDNWVCDNLNIESDEIFITEIKKIIELKEIFFENENDLFSSEFKWYKYYNSLTIWNQKIIDELKKKENWRKTFLIFYLNSMLINSANIDLPTDENEHVELNRSLFDLEKEQLKFIKEYWYSKQIDATREFNQNHPDIAVENLYNKKSGSKYKRLSLRKIVKYDLDLFTTFFPIILTTPDVCCNLFKNKNQYFDIVLFDEASQLKLEDNLPALLKGKQIIIAGDEHQMPPSNYFSKIFDGSIDDEDEFEDENEIKVDRDNILLSCESLLDFATELSFEKKYLDFHYRSRHPYLIDFSNYAFYNQRLKPLPNSLEYIPIKYVPVNGTYSDTSNELEAETVLSIIENNILRLPNGEYPTVGVATFNINQRNLILGKINERRKFDKFKSFNDKIIELEESGFFVKNLENIQGDERDVIILSTTYGINKDNKFAQRFGSINHQKGYKLLNVIITRAKYKVYVCSSIPEEVFLNYKEYLTVEGANNRRSVFFAYLAYAKAVSDQDNEARIAVLNTLAENSKTNKSYDSLNADLESPFEEEVYQSLLDHFNVENIIPQLQFAGFRIDLVYDSKILGIPKIAIECDGASYHSSQEAYLHDSHRQKILEGHGFVFHRIWSTNWWRNPKKETKKLVQFIKYIENGRPKEDNQTSEIALAFTDNISIIENELNKLSPSLQEDLKEAIASAKEKIGVQTELFKDKITANCEVKVKYLNNGTDIKVFLVDEIISRQKKSGEIKKININSPLGASLVGRTVGETVKIGKLDNYIEILEFVNKAN